jgi:hypothetical protein
VSLKTKNSIVTGVVEVVYLQVDVDVSDKYAVSIFRG